MRGCNHKSRIQSFGSSMQSLKVCSFPSNSGFTVYLPKGAALPPILVLRITNPKFPRFLHKFFIEIKFFSASPRLRGATGFLRFFSVSQCLRDGFLVAARPRVSALWAVAVGDFDSVSGMGQAFFYFFGDHDGAVLSAGAA